MDPDPIWIRIQELCGSGSIQVKKDKLKTKGVRMDKKNSPFTDTET